MVTVQAVLLVLVLVYAVVSAEDTMFFSFQVVHGVFVLLFAIVEVGLSSFAMKSANVARGWLFAVSEDAPEIVMFLYGAVICASPGSLKDNTATTRTNPTDSQQEQVRTYYGRIQPLVLSTSKHL